MRRLSNILSAVFTLCVILTTASCEKRPLVDMDHRTNVSVMVNIDAISNVTCDIYNEKIATPKIEPLAMHVLFFDNNTNKVVSESFINDISYNEDGRRMLSGKVSLLPGTYNMLIYDFGTEATIVDNYYIWDECKASTNEISPALKRSFVSKAENKSWEDAYIVYEPDHLVVATHEDEHVPYHEGVHTIETEAKSVVESYYLQIKVDGLEYVSSAQAVLSGMVNSNIITSNTRVVEPQATIWFDLEKSDDNGIPVICTVFNTFGRIADSQNELEVTFDIKTHDGRIIQRTFDITELFSTPECIEHHWLLLDETITIEPPQIPGGGFAPEVDDWEEENREIFI